MGLCTPVRSVARSLGNRINNCTEYDEDIDKCWEQPVPKPDKIGELLLKFYRLMYLKYFTDNYDE